MIAYGIGEGESGWSVDYVVVDQRAYGKLYVEGRLVRVFLSMIRHDGRFRVCERLGIGTGITFRHCARSSEMRTFDPGSQVE